MKSSSNILAYLGIFILLIFIVVPPVLRVFVPKENEITSVANKVVMKLSCSRTESTPEYSLTRNIDSKYEDGVLVETLFTYSVTFTENLFTMDSITIDDYETLKKIPNSITTEDKTQYTVKFDYVSNDYSNNKDLANHSKLLSEQLKYYAEENYICTTARQN